MKSEERLNNAIENMEIISKRLRELSNLINTIHLGLMEENTEQQVLDCVMCFLYSVNEIHGFTEQTIKKIRVKDNNSN